MTVFTRAISRRTFLSCEVLFSCCVALCISRLLRDWLIWENPNPDTATALDVARHCTTSRFNLTRGNTTTANCLQAKLTKRHSSAARVRNARVTAFLLFTIFSACWLQHDYS